MSDIEAFERSMGKPLDITIGKDVFKLQPLDFDYFVDIFKIQRHLTKLRGSKTKEEILAMSKEEQKTFFAEQTVEFFDSFDNESLELIKKVVKATLKKSYPQIDEKKHDAFAMANFMDLLFPVLEVNSFSTKDSAQIEKEMKDMVKDETKPEGQSPE